VITATPVTVPTTAGGIKLGDFANVYVTISNQGGNTVYLGTSTSVTTTNGVGIPTGTVLPLGRVTGTLWAIAGTQDVIGLLVVSPE
jgi:hypothetical protein